MAYSIAYTVLTNTERTLDVLCQALIFLKDKDKAQSDTSEGFKFTLEVYLAQANHEWM